MNGSINNVAKTCSCGSYLDVPSTMCLECWREYAQLIEEEIQVEPKKLFVGSGEDVCLHDN